MPLYDGMVRALEDYVAEQLRAEIKSLRAALAAATERGEAAEARTAKACGCEWEDGSRRLHGGDLDVMCAYHRGVEGRAAELAAVAAALKHANDLREVERRERDAAIERAEDLKTAWRVANARADDAIARADALAARLAEVDVEIGR